MRAVQYNPRYCDEAAVEFERTGRVTGWDTSVVSQIEMFLFCLHRAMAWAIFVKLGALRSPTMPMSERVQKHELRIQPQKSGLLLPRMPQRLAGKRGEWT